MLKKFTQHDPPGNPKPMRSISEPSIGNITALTGTSHGSNLYQRKGFKTDLLFGSYLWEGRMRPITMAVMMLPWSFFWQVFIIVQIVYAYIIHLLVACYWPNELLRVTLHVVEVFFVFDLMIHILHAFWPLVRLNIRVYRRHYLLILYDLMTLFPVEYVCYLVTCSRTLYLLDAISEVSRIYRLVLFFSEINGTMRNSRHVVIVVQHWIMSFLVLHGSACFWYVMNQPVVDTKPWSHLSYPPHVSLERLKFNTYTQCWYYCATRFYNVIFGDSFPRRIDHMWLTIFLTIMGYVYLRYRFIGYLSWEIAMLNSRWSKFVDTYHHMVANLKFPGAPEWLVIQAMNYKRQLWTMKDGILNSEHLQDLPHPMQMELIFDINVGHFHNTLLFRNAGEAFLRQCALLMRHEIFLAGQKVWCQGVVKSGMICIKRGVLEMLSDEDDESPMIAFTEGTVLGELCLFYSKPSKVTIKAATYVELQVLKRTDFMRAMMDNPVMLHKIRSIMETRLKSAKKRQGGIENYDKGDSRLIRTRYRPMKILKDKLAGIDEEDPTFVDDSHLYYRDENHLRQPKFTEEYLALYVLSNNVTTVDTPRMCLRANFPWILEPDTGFTNLFDAVHFVMVLYVCITVPHQTIFGSSSHWEQIIHIIIMTGLMLNIYIQLTTAIIEKNVRKVTLKEIAAVKMSTIGFYLDVLAVSPLYVFSETLDPHGQTVWKEICLLLPILQVWHLASYIRKWEKKFESNVKILVIIKFTILLLIGCYWSGCLLFMFACPKKLCREHTWMSLLIFLETKVYLTSYAKHERPKLTSLSFGTSVFTGSGITELSPGPKDLLIVVLIIIIGTYLSCYYVASVCSVYLLSTKRRLLFRESMRELFYFLTVNQVSAKIKARVKKFFSVQWYYNNAVSTDEIFKDMSSNIQQEVLSTRMVETLLYCPLFQECNSDFLQTVAANTRKIILPDNEVVQHAADIGRDMYIIKKGYCNVISHNGKIVKTIGPGDHIGAVEMIFGLPKVYTVITSTNCVLGHMEYSSLVQCWSTFPDIYNPILKVLQDSEVLSITMMFEEAKHLTGRMDVKKNRIAKEIKESFAVLSSHQQKKEFVMAFEKLGIMRYVRYLFVPGTITPHGLFLKYWCALRFVLAIYYVLTIPYNIATKHYKHCQMAYWTDILLYLDIVIMSYVAYYNEKSVLVIHPFLTATRYLKHLFVWDAISVFPIEQVFRVINDNTDMDMCRLNRLLLVTRITGAFAHWETNIMKVNLVVVLMKFLPPAIAFVNLVTSMIFMNACVSFYPPDANFIMVNCTRALVVSVNRRFEISYAITEYGQTLFWVFEVFAGCGSTPVALSGQVDVWLVMVLQVTGFLYFALMYGYVASTRSAAANSLLEHTENTTDLENFLYQQNVDPMLTAKTLRYFEYVWKRTNGSNPQQICRRLNSTLMEDTLVFMYERALREVPLFGKVDRSFIRVITQHLSEMYFLKGETVVQYKDLQQYIFIIYRGKVDVLNSYNEMVTCMGPGGMFGNFTGQPVSCSEVSIFASRSLDLLVIPSRTFYNLIRYYPKIQEPLRKAFILSKDYILPISMEIQNDSSSDESEDDEIRSHSSGIDSRSGSSTSRIEMTGNLSSRTSSHSNVSQTKSATSVLTFQSYMHLGNLLRPGTYLYQSFGYTTCFMVTINYMLILYEMVTLNDCLALFWLQSICDIYFYVKIYLTMHQGYVNKRGDFVTDGRKCRLRYFKHKFGLWCDVIANFPLEPIGLFCPMSLTIVHYLRVNKLLRLQYLVEFYRRTSAELTNNLTILQTVMTAVVVALLIHTFSCVWLLSLIITQPISFIRTLKMNQIDEETPQRRWDYTSSLYVVVSELTTTGGDEFVIEGIPPVIILALSVVSGKMLAAIVVATSIQIAYATRYALNCYEVKTAELTTMLQNQGLSAYQYKKLKKYVKQLWINERGRQLPVLLSQTPYVRRCDLMSAMFGHHIRNCYLFAECSEPFLRQLTARIEYTVFFPGNYIVVAGDSEARMHWVATGNVSVVSVRSDLTETTHEMLGPGDVFGILQGLNRGVTHCFSYRAETKVAVLTLSLDSWINILPYFPEVQKMISERSEILFAQI